MIRKSKFNLIIGISILLFSCDRPACENKIPAFDMYDPNTIEYKSELASQIETDNDLSYWFDKYEVNEHKEYIVVFIQGKEFCAQGSILVNDWIKLQGIKNSHGQGYEGAELKGLRFDIQNDSGDIEFVFKDINKVID